MDSTLWCSKADCKWTLEQKASVQINISVDRRFLQSVPVKPWQLHQVWSQRPRRPSAVCSCSNDIFPKCKLFLDWKNYLTLTWMKHPEDIKKRTNGASVNDSHQNLHSKVKQKMVNVHKYLWFSWLMLTTFSLRAVDIHQRVKSSVVLLFSFFTQFFVPFLSFYRS